MSIERSSDKSIYRIQVEGQLNDGWNISFPDMTITEQIDGTTDICGWIEDQSALHGVLARLRDLNINLLRVEHASGWNADFCFNCRRLADSGEEVSAED